MYQKIPQNASFHPNTTIANRAPMNAMSLPRSCSRVLYSSTRLAIARSAPFLPDIMGNSRMRNDAMHKRSWFERSCTMILHFYQSRLPIYEPLKIIMRSTGVYLNKKMLLQKRNNIIKCPIHHAARHTSGNVRIKVRASSKLNPRCFGIRCVVVV